MSDIGIQKDKVFNSLILISGVLVLIHFFPPECFFALVLFCIGLGLYEFYRLVSRMDIPVFGGLGGIGGISLGLAFVIEHYFYQGNSQLDVIKLTLFLFIFCTMVRALFVKDSPSITLALLSTLAGVLYVSYLSSYLIVLRSIPNGNNFTSLVFIVTWARDAGAYGIGSLLKSGHVMFPGISPRKTLEGTLAGIFFALFFSLLTKVFFFANENYFHFIVIGILLGIIGQLGDLVESLLKRSAGVKDAGTILPLHGGILDRVDGLLFTAPTLYYYIKIFMTPS